MDRPTAIAELPGAYATDELSNEAIAAWLSVATEAVRPLFCLAEANLVLPPPPIPIRSVAVDCGAIYGATLGRGQWRVVNYQ